MWVGHSLASEWLQTAEMLDCLTVTCRDEAARIWQQRESEWERERLARQQLMQEVSCCLELQCCLLLLT